jgi:hypothetical protein
MWAGGGGGGAKVATHVDSCSILSPPPRSREKIGTDATTDTQERTHVDRNQCTGTDIPTDSGRDKEIEGAGEEGVDILLQSVCASVCLRLCVSAYMNTCMCT